MQKSISFTLALALGGGGGTSVATLSVVVALLLLSTVDDDSLKPPQDVLNDPLLTWLEENKGPAGGQNASTTLLFVHTTTDHAQNTDQPITRLILVIFPTTTPTVSIFLWSVYSLVRSFPSLWAAYLLLFDLSLFLAVIATVPHNSFVVKKLCGDPADKMEPVSSGARHKRA
jgi:hypothetical protein